MARAKTNTGNGAVKGSPPIPKAGRPTKKTPATIADLLEAIEELGLCDKSACEYAGISQETFIQWRKADPAFSERIAQARAKFKAWHIRNILASAPRDARHSEWILRNMFSGEFAERQGVDVTANTASPLDKLFEPAPPESTAGPDDTPQP